MICLTEIKFTFDSARRIYDWEYEYIKLTNAVASILIALSPYAQSNTFGFTRRFWAYHPRSLGWFVVLITNQFDICFLYIQPFLCKYKYY